MEVRNNDKQLNPVFEQMIDFIYDFIHFSGSTDEYGFISIHRDDMRYLLSDTHTIYLFREIVEDFEYLPELAEKIDSLDAHKGLMFINLKNTASLDDKNWRNIMTMMDTIMETKIPDAETLIGIYFPDSHDKQENIEHLNGVAFVLAFRDKPLLPPKNKNTIVIDLQHFSKINSPEYDRIYF